jgi:hypothetical protein
MIARPAVLVLLFAVVCAACTSGGAARTTANPAATAPSPTAATVAPSPTPVRTPTPAATPTPAVASSPMLTFTGSLAGQATGLASSGPCGRAPAGFAADLRFSVAGRSYALSIAVFDYHGPGSYPIPPERVAVTSGQGVASQLLPATSGSLTVDAGERSGRIDATIGDGTTRVSGVWACS